jgi:hypothetical protein
MEFGKQLCDALRVKGHWADYIDPCSGLPVLSRAFSASCCGIICYFLVVTRAISARGTDANP